MTTFAGLNQLYLCTVCSRAFRDREAALPLDVTVERYEQAVLVPHPTHPEIAELTKTEYAAVDGVVTVASRAAAACCVEHATLCDSRGLRVVRGVDGDCEILGARRALAL